MKGGIKVHIKLSKGKKISKISKTPLTKSWSINIFAKAAKMANLMVSLSTLYCFFSWREEVGKLHWVIVSENVRDFSIVVHQPITWSLKGAVYFSGIKNSAYLGLASNGWVQFPERRGIPDGREAVLFRGVKLPSEPRELERNFRHLILSEFGFLSFEMPCLNKHFNPLSIFPANMSPCDWEN